MKITLVGHGHRAQFVWPGFLLLAQQNPSSGGAWRHGGCAPCLGGRLRVSGAPIWVIGCAIPHISKSEDRSGRVIAAEQCGHLRKWAGAGRRDSCWATQPASSWAL